MRDLDEEFELITFGPEDSLRILARLIIERVRKDSQMVLREDGSPARHGNIGQPQTDDHGRPSA